MTPKSCCSASSSRDRTPRRQTLLAPVARSCSTAKQEQPSSESKPRRGSPRRRRLSASQRSQLSHLDRVWQGFAGAERWVHVEPWLFEYVRPDSCWAETLD